MFSYLKKGRHFLAVHLLRRSLPHGMICPFYLLPFPPKNMRIHRRIWQNAMPGLPLWAYFSVELALWLRWVLFSGWRATFRAVQKHGIRVKDRTGMGRFAQFIRVGARALFFCIPPHEIYAFRLFDRKAGQKVTDYIFTNEVTGFHRVRNMGKNICRKAALLLQDKYAFTNMARSRGLPVVPILALVKKGEAVDPLPHLEAHDALFLKPRKGSGAKDAFVISKNQLGVPAMFHTKSGMKAQPAPISDLSKAMQKRDYIISPLMINHPMLAGLASLDDAVTIRVITECGNDSKVKIYCAMLEVPRYTQSPKGLRPNAHRIVPIDPESGNIPHLPSDRRPINAAPSDDDSIYNTFKKDPVPFWPQIRHTALKAHAATNGGYGLAWDFVVTENGGFLLEGNTGWGTSTPQIFNGGMLIYT